MDEGSRSKDFRQQFFDELRMYELHDSTKKFDDDADVVGFDFDHTFFSYNIYNLLEHIYFAFTKFLVYHKGYPKVLLFEENHDEITMQNVHKFACTEIVLDLTRGNMLKLDKNKSPAIVFHGVTKISSEEAKKIYGEEVEVSFENSKTKDYFINFTNFENHFIPIFAFCVHLFDNNQLPQISSYSDILHHITEAIKFNYSIKDPVTNKIHKMEEFGYYFPELCKNTDKYITKNFQYIEILQKLKAKGKRIFIVTNSTYEYTYTLMKAIFGVKDFRDFFDIIVFYSKKPAFFNKTLLPKGYFLDFQEGYAHNGEEISLENIETIFSKLMKAKMMNEGNFLIIEKFYELLLQKKDIKYAYVGDHILNDCLVIAKEIRYWKVVLISNYFKSNTVEVHKDYAEKWGDYFHHIEEENKMSTYSHQIIKDYQFYVIPNIEAILLLFENI